jgi:hypothetical protein
MTYRYSAYGLKIESVFALPELGAARAEGEDSPDVMIRIGPLPAIDELSWTQSGPFSWVAEDAYWLEVRGVLRLLVRNGTEMVIEPAPGVDDDSLRTFVLGSGFGALLFQRGYLVLHGNAIRVGDQCLICIGPSGAGKSTVSAMFLQRGYQVLADDVVPVDIQGRALPGFPRIKLWQDAAEHLALETKGLRRVRPMVEKFNLLVAQPYDGPPLPVRWIYILDTERKPEITLEPVRGMQRLKPLRENTYSIRMIRSSAAKSEQLKQCAKLAIGIRLSRISRPAGGFSAGAMVDRMLADMAENP